MLDCIKKAGALTLRYFTGKNYQVSMKSPDNPLTEADLAVNSLLMQAIKENFPDDAVLSEEVSLEDSSFPNRHEVPRVWIIDPIDGTKEFIDGLPEFSISVGLVENNQPGLGFIFNPAKDFFIHGGKKTGIFINSQPVFKNQIKPTSLEQLYPCFSRSEFKRGLFEEYTSRIPIKDEQVFGSIAYKMGMVAAGEFNLVISHRPKK